MRSLVLMLQSHWIYIYIHLWYQITWCHMIIGANRGGNVKCGQDVAAASPCSSHFCAMNLKWPQPTLLHVSWLLLQPQGQRPVSDWHHTTQRTWMLLTLLTFLHALPCNSPILMHLPTPLLLSAWMLHTKVIGWRSGRPPSASLGIHTCQGFLSFSCLARKICL